MCECVREKVRESTRMVVKRWVETAVGDVFKDGARMLKIKLRNRLRVAVDRHRRLAGLYSFDDGGHFSSTMQRWIQRLSDFRRDSLPSSNAFYRKRGCCFLLSSLFSVDCCLIRLGYGVMVIRCCFVLLASVN